MPSRSPTLSGAPSTTINDINTVKAMKAHKNRMARIRDKKSMSFLGAQQSFLRDQMTQNYQRLKDQVQLINSIKEQRRGQGKLGISSELS